MDVRIPSATAAIRDLSGGQRQGVAIARATHWAGKLVLMDEPTAALGVAETAKVEKIIAGLKERNLAVLLISHSLDQVFRLSDRICVLRRGRAGRRAANRRDDQQRDRRHDHRGQVALLEMLPGFPSLRAAAHPGRPLPADREQERRRFVVSHET